MSLRYRGRLLGLGCATFALVLAGYAAWDQGWTYDERIHLGWSELLLAGEADRTATRRYESKTPVSIVNVLARRVAPQDGGEKISRFAARAPQLLWLAALLATTFAFARGRWGGRVGVIAMILVALDPNIIAHSTVVAVDAPYALATLLFVWTALRAAESPTVARLAVLGVVLGAAFAVKFTAVLLLVCIGALFLVARGPRLRPTRAALLAATAASAACLTLSAAYLFSGFGVRLVDLELRSFLDRILLVQGLPLPLPEPFITGLDLTLLGERTVSWQVWLFGRPFPDGVYYYFFALWLLKTPLAILAAHVAGVLTVLRSEVLRRDPTLRYLAAVVLIHLAYFSFLFRAQIGYRFVLMCVPLLAVIAAVGLAAILVSRRAVTLGLIGIAFAAGENLLYRGDPIAFSNVAVRPKSQVFRLMADSNVAWGQNRERLAPTLKRLRAAPTRVNPIHPLQGSNTYQINELAGVTAPLERHRWLRENATPAGLFTHSFVWYDISKELYDRYLADERTFAPHAFAERLCQGAPLQRYPRGSRVEFGRREQPAAGARTVVCIETRTPAEIGVRIVKGQIKTGVFDAEGDCATTTLSKRRVSWSRLLPGFHALCLEEIPNRRDFIPYSVDAVVIVRRHGASIAILGPDEAPVDEPTP